jgi:predicted N-acetyltransferase YhbS
MVLVAGEYRRRGLATALLRHAMSDLEAGGLRAVLDATPDGRAVYRRLGFVDSWGFHRLIRRERPPATAPAPGDLRCIVRPLSESDWSNVTAYDASAFGAERSAVLARLHGQLPRANLIAERDGTVAGALLGRDGRLAQHVGPVIAEDEAVACALLERALAALEGPVIMDVADEKLAVRQFLAERGFAAVRPFTRMIYGTPTRFDDATRTYAVVGPEFG